MDEFYFDREFPDIFKVGQFGDIFCINNSTWHNDTYTSHGFDSKFYDVPFKYVSNENKVCSICNSTGCDFSYSWIQDYSVIVQVTENSIRTNEFRETHNFVTWTKEKVQEYHENKESCVPDKTKDYELFAVVGRFEKANNGELEESKDDLFCSCIIKQNDDNWLLYKEGSVVQVKADKSDIRKITKVLRLFYTPKDIKGFVDNLKKESNKEREETSTSLSEYVLSLIAQSE